MRYNKHYMSLQNRNFNRRYAEDYGIIRTIYITLFLYFVVWPAAIFFYNIKIKGWKNIDRRNRYIYTSNHQSYIDPPLISIVANRPVAYMAKQELFTHKNPLIRFLVISLGSFAVNRDKPELATIKTIKTIENKTKWNFGIFPQGKTCYKENEPFKDIKSGFTSVAKITKTDIVPVAICGFSGYANFPFSKHITLKIGKPISYKLSEDEILRQWLNFMNNNFTE